jgi:ABC-type multidrug transport system fused ATPase/permease subunit
MFEQLYREPGAPDLRSPARFMAWLARRQRGLIAVGACFGVLWMTAQAAIPLALGAALGSMVRNDKNQVLVWAAVLLGLGILQAAAGVLRHRRAVMNFMTVSCRVERLVGRHSCDLGAEMTERLGTGEIASVGASDVERIGEAMDCSARTAGAIVSYLAVAVVLLVVSPPLGAVVVLGVPVSMAVVAPLLRPLERRQSAERDSRAAASSLASDTVIGLRVLRGLGGERVFSDRFASASGEVAKASIRTAVVQSYLDGGQVLLPGALVVVITFLGARYAVHGSISAGELVAFYASAAFLLLPMQTFVEAASKWTAALVASRRIIGVLSIERSIADPAEPASLTTAGIGVMSDAATGTVIQPGRLTAIAPATPEEGSELLDRLARYRPSGQPVTLGGVPIEDFELSALRSKVLLLERSSVQLSERLGDIFETEGRPADGQRDIIEAATLTEVIDGLPEGLETLLPERWRTLSGGQRQRLALARALVADPEVLMLDDPTSAVDAHTEAAIADRLCALRTGKTTVIVTTSPLLLDRADEVLLLDGSVLASGTHRHLLAAQARYAAIVTRGVEDEGAEPAEATR